MVVLDCGSPAVLRFSSAAGPLARLQSHHHHGFR